MHVHAAYAPCSPQTLTRAARDFEDNNPAFAIEAGMAALHWLAQGYGYKVTNVDVTAAYEHAMKAAYNARRSEQTQLGIQELVATASQGLASRLGVDV